MAFRTNKVPAIEERTVSGSSVSFNSAFALPLKACKVSFSATQAGSGEPSPSNPRAISGVSLLNVVVNGSTISENLGDTYAKGTLNLLTGLLIITEVFLKNATWTKIPSSNYGTFYTTPSPLPLFGASSDINCNCNYYTPTSAAAASSGGDNYLYVVSNKTIRIKDTSRASLTEEEFKEFIDENIQLTYKLETPITIQLSANELSSITGNNTFSTDTGTLEITFSDLQEKSASGSVASFNTALAMPLVNGEFSIEAYQEGTGEPSPTNVRAIHGFDKTHIVNMSDVTNKAYFEGLLNGTYGFVDLGSLNWNFVSQQRWSSNGVNTTIKSPVDTLTKVNAICTVGSTYSNANLYSDISLIGMSCNTTGDIQVRNGSTTNTPTGYLIYELATPTTPTITDADFNMLLSAFGIDGMEVTVNFGQEVYGGSYNSVSGKLFLTHQIITRNYSAYDLGNGVFQLALTNAVGYNGDNASSVYRKNPTNNLINIQNYCYICRNIVIYIKNEDYMNDLEGFNSYMSDKQVVIELANPIEIQLTPTQINTFNGANNIFCDTGDTSVVYKDLDIAKRGNFREVFRLPS